MKHYLPLAFVTLALAGCASTREPRIMVKEVRVPVAVKCAAEVAEPALPDTDEAIKAAPDIDALARLYRAGRLLRMAYEGELRAALKGCAG